MSYLSLIRLLQLESGDILLLLLNDTLFNTSEKLRNGRWSHMLQGIIMILDAAGSLSAADEKQS